MWINCYIKKVGKVEIAFYFWYIKLIHMAYKKSVLLTRNNHKTIKGEKKGYITYILYMSPYKDNSKGINLCSHASKGCSSACLFKSGFGGLYDTVQEGRRNKTEWYLSNREEFMKQLDKEIGAALNRHKDKHVVFRLNGTSDIRWEKIKVRDNKNIFELYPKTTFYDYTKNPMRFDIELPKNYSLTFSRSESNHKVAMGLLARGFNVAIVFDKGLPKVYEGYKVINGDETDLRFKDKKGVIVGLKYKNNTGKGGKVANEYARKSGFVIPA